MELHKIFGRRLLGSIISPGFSSSDRAPPGEELIAFAETLAGNRGGWRAGLHPGAGAGALGQRPSCGAVQGEAASPRDRTSAGDASPAGV